MKINAISTDYSAGSKAKRVGLKVKKNDVDLPTNQSTNLPKGMTIVSFKGGNKAQAIEYVAELKPYFQVGGVATACHDRRTLRVSDADPLFKDEFRSNTLLHTPDNKVFVTPFYNGSLIYDTEKGLLKNVEVPKIPAGLPDDSPFKKYEGKYFMTNSPKFQNYATPEEFFKKEAVNNPATGNPNLNLNKQIFILEDVTGPTKKMMDFGGEGAGETEIKLFRVFVDEKGTLKPTNDFTVFTDVNASLVRPYADGGYSTGPGKLTQSWKGVSDARGAKGFVEQLERICEVKSLDGVKFDPATIVLNDSQAMYAAEYMAEKAAKGGEFWQGKKPTAIGHNLGDGYTQSTSFMNMFINIADKDMRNAVYKDPQCKEAFMKGTDEVERYFRNLIPTEMIDKQGKVSPFKNTLYYVKHGYVPSLGTVSEPYAKKIATDPDFAPGNYEALKELFEKDKLVGILNAHEDASMDPYKGGVGGYYGAPYTFADNVTINGEKNYTISSMKVFDEKLVNEKSVDMKHVKEIKRQNKISLFERLDKEVLEKLEAMKEVSGREYDLATKIAGLADKEVKVYGHIDKTFLNEVKKPNSDVKLLVSWGRGDDQKALDSVLESFEKYILGPGKKDKNTVLVLGGELQSAKESILNTFNRMNNNPLINGRVVLIDGFTPNKPLASAGDFAVFPSRFAPCELTDLESMKVFCSPIVTDCQGLSQKNFDPGIVGEADIATGYKTKHEFNMSFEELKPLLPEKDKAKMEKDVKKFRDEIKRDELLKHAKNLTEAEVDEKIRTSGGLHYDYNYKILRPYRDQVISDELCNCYERALITDRNTEIQNKMVQNHLKQYTGWENNGKLSKTKKSSAQLYREYMFQRDGVAVKEEETLLYKIRQKCKDAGVFERAEKAGAEGGSPGGSGKSWWNKLVDGVKKNKKAVGITAGAVGLVGLGYAGYKYGWFNAKFEEKKNHGHLSCVG